MTLTLLVTFLLAAGLGITWRFISNSLLSNHYKEVYRGDNLGYEEVY